MEDAKNKLTAIKLYKIKKERAILSALYDKVEVTVDTACFICGDSKVELKKVESKSWDMVLTDPPFGKFLEMKADLRTGETPYKDDPRKVFADMKVIVREYYRVLKDDRVKLLFFDVMHYEKVVKICEEAGFLVCQTPLTWCKTGGGGALPNDTYYAMNTELILHCQKGSRPLNHPGQPNFLVYERVPSQLKVHETQRPTSLLRYLIEQHTAPGELVGDGYAGSASTLISAFECGRRAWGCELSKENHVKGILEIEKLMKKTTEEGR